MSESETPNAAPEASRWIAFSYPGFPRYWAALILIGFSVQIQTVAVGWQVYDLTRNPFDLGLVGLSQFLPALVLVLVTGVVADRFSRRKIMSLCLLVEASVSLGLLLATYYKLADVRVIFALLAVFGTARAFYNPARQAIISNLVPGEHLGKAFSVSITAMHVATICGPMVGGLLYGLRAEYAYASSLALTLIASIVVLSIPRPAQRLSSGFTTWATLSAGFRYIWTEKVVLGAISLDLFAVLLGGAVALLPIYARDILEVGPFGLGLLRSGSAIGAITVGLALMARPIHDHAGRIMFGAVATFGVFTLIFAFSTALWLSVAALMVMGGADMVSVYIRNTLIQLWTPDELRGRVNAVNQVFIGASNEFGAFRAGTMAALIGPVTAVFVGGLGTLAVAGLWARWFPGLRDIREIKGR